jgi:integrase
MATPRIRPTVNAAPTPDQSPAWKRLLTVPFSHMIDRYVLEIHPTLAVKTQTTEQTHQKAVFGAMLLKDIEPHHIAAYLDQRVSKIAANREITFLSSMFAYAMRWGWCRFNPCTGVRRNSERKRTRHITDDELTVLMDKANDQLACIIELAYLTGAQKRLVEDPPE